MKKLIIIALLSLSFTVSAQQLPIKEKSKPVSVKDTIIQGVKFPLYVGSKGGKYIIVTSKKGTEYKKYFTAKKD